MADPTFDQVGAFAAGVAPINVAFPAAATADQRCYLLCFARNNSATFNTPTGWTLDISANNDGTGHGRAFVFSKVLSSADITAGQVSNVDTDLSEATGIGAFTFTIDADDHTNIEIVGETQLTPVSATTATGADIVATKAGCLVSFATTSDDNALTLNSGNEQSFTERAGGAAYDSTAGNDFSMGLATRDVTTSGTFTQPTWEETVNNPNGIGIFGFAIQDSTPPVTGTLAVTLDDFTMETVGGTVRPPAVGTMAVTLDDFTMTAVGEAKITPEGTMAAILEDFTMGAAGGAQGAQGAVGGDVKPYRYWHYWRTVDGDLTLVESTRRLRQGGWSTADSFEKVSERFRTNILLERSYIEAAVNAAWLANSGEAAATLQTALHAALNAAGIKKYDGTALS